LSKDETTLPKPEYTASTEIVKIANILRKQFGEEPEKIVYWLLTFNPNFEGAPAVSIFFRPKASCDMIESLFNAGILDPYERRRRNN